MRAVLSALALLAVSGTAMAEQRVERPPSPPVRVQLDSMPIGPLVVMLMRDVMGVPYVIAPDVLKDARPVSVNLTMARADLPVKVVHFLRSIGLTVTLRGGTVYVTKGEIQADPSAALGVAVAPASPVPDAVDLPFGRSSQDLAKVNGAAGPMGFAVIEPAHARVLELLDVLQGVLPQLKVAARRGSSPDGAQLVDRLDPSELVVSGPVKVVDRAIDLVRLLDKPRPTVEIRAVVFEVRDTASSQSALSIIAKLGGLGVTSQPGSSTPGEQFVRLAAGGIQAVLSATKGDGRFRVVAEPSLAALSGTVATIKSGSQVPTIGGVSYADDGTPVRSVVYRDSGLTLSVRPIVRGGEIELAVTQERSSFVRTNTGVDDSPTLNQATATAQVAIAPGETVAIAGLDERSETSNKSGFLGGILGAHERSTDRGQLLLLVQADLAAQSRGGETVVHRLDPVGDDGDDADKGGLSAESGKAAA